MNIKSRANHRDAQDPDRIGAQCVGYPDLSPASDPGRGSAPPRTVDDWNADEVDDMRIAKGIAFCCLAGAGTWLVIGVLAWRFMVG
jgi:hypothetical protein